MNIEKIVYKLKCMGKKVKCFIGNVIIVNSDVNTNWLKALNDNYDKYTIINGNVTIEKNKYSLVRVDSKCIHCMRNNDKSYNELYDIIFDDCTEIHSVEYYFYNENFKLYKIVDSDYYMTHIYFTFVNNDDNIEYIVDDIEEGLTGKTIYNISFVYSAYVRFREDMKCQVEFIEVKDGYDYYKISIARYDDYILSRILIKARRLKHE